MMMAATKYDDLVLNIVSYNMHGFRQGCPAVEDLISAHCPNVILLQEHWLTPANLHKFDRHFSNFFSFGSSAMSKTVESGMLCGRPFGGVMILIDNKLRKVTETIVCDERFAIVRISNVIIVNVYLPCSGTPHRTSICEEMFSDINSWLQRFPQCEYVLAGDFNCNLDSNDLVTQHIVSFINDFSLKRCDKLFTCGKSYTYMNAALNSQSYIDYALVSCDHVTHFSVLDPDINFSDHIPLWLTIVCKTSVPSAGQLNSYTQGTPVQRYLRWDKADLSAYYEFTGRNLVPLLNYLDSLYVAEHPNNDCIDYIYEYIVTVLMNAEAQFVPKHSKNFFKFWWNEELDILKKASIETNDIWKMAGQPRSGPIFDKRQSARRQYRKCLREHEMHSTTLYTNNLHEALLKKNGVAFWKCWRSNFEPVNRCVQVDGCMDSDLIVNKFAEHFSNAYQPNNRQRAQALHSQYVEQRETYSGFPLTDDHTIDTELVSSVISRLQCGKAADMDGLTAEHILYSHPALCVLFCKLFKLIMACKYVPVGFRYSYIVPVPKIKDLRSKSLTYNDFRGIAISSIISKVFEYCILDRFNSYLSSSDIQFGFKKNSGCRNAIYTARTIVERLNKNGSTANICAIDLTKAFDKVDHNALYMKLMKRFLPTELLTVLENWLSECYTCVKWNMSWSCLFQVFTGVRQGSVLSPVLFSVYIDGISKLHDPNNGAYVILYADDILLMSHSTSTLQTLLTTCENELDTIGMAINTRKSCCIRVGPRHNIPCAAINTNDGSKLLWSEELRYLGVFIVRCASFRCSIDYAKRSFYRAANGIFAKLGRLASEEVILELIMKKCIPVLLYGLEVCDLPKRTIQSLDFSVNRVLMKLFRSSNIEIIAECRNHFGVELPSVQLAKRFKKFSDKICNMIA